MKVLFFAAELTPIAKIGGLGDVVGALPKALQKLGLDVRIVIPKYGIVDEIKYPLKRVGEPVSFPYHGRMETVRIMETPLPGTSIPVYLIDHYDYLGRDGVYFESDPERAGPEGERERFTFFSRACVEIFEALEFWPDIIHIHDWHVGIIPTLFRWKSPGDPSHSHIRTILTIHNIALQGIFRGADVLNTLRPEANDRPTLTVHEDGTTNYLEQAILTADALNTVSPTYAVEILTKESGCGLEGSLNKRKGDLSGILNGIDTEHFNPETDPVTTAHYSSSELAGKEKCKLQLQKICGLPLEGHTPIIGLVSRLTDQKGIDLVEAIVKPLMALPVQFVLLGSGEKRFEQALLMASKKYPKKMFCRIGFYPPFAQQIYAGADMFLMPSRYEPCGLGQMIAMRYGTIPIVRATGGLKDTVADYNYATGSGDGFVFQNYRAEELLAAIKHALSLFENKKIWYTMVQRVMEKNFSWDSSAKEYVQLYQNTLKKNYGNVHPGA